MIDKNCDRCLEALEALLSIFEAPKAGAARRQEVGPGPVEMCNPRSTLERWTAAFCVRRIYLRNEQMA